MLVCVTHMKIYTHSKKFPNRFFVENTVVIGLTGKFFAKREGHRYCFLNGTSTIFERPLTYNQLFDIEIYEPFFIAFVDDFGEFSV